MVFYLCAVRCFVFFFFNDTATTEIYTLSLHDALPILARTWRMVASRSAVSVFVIDWTATGAPPPMGTPPTAIWRLEGRSEEHTSELQSRQYLVCRLLLEKKKEHNIKLVKCDYSRIWYT